MRICRKFWNGYGSVSDADIILLAVKPWLVDNVVEGSTCRRASIFKRFEELSGE
ncbi:MAG: hypothetical protein LBG45_03040 [Dysgonamonadaceae bacterium]|nr:hypothetical protein [Dysgonamonadaceae bacterium]